MNGCRVGGEEIPEELVGEFADSAALLGDPPALRWRMDEDGYLFFRGALDPGEVAAARIAVLERLVEVGEIHPPAIEGIATGTSRRREVAGDLGAFWKSVSETPEFRGVTHGPRLRSVMDTVFGEPSRPHDYLFLRVGVAGRYTDLHYDYPFFSRGSQRVHTVWLALGDVPVVQGPLVVVEGSHRFDDLIGASRVDYATQASRRVALTEDPVTLARNRGVRLLTADFRAGDLVVFGMSTLHGALDNHSPEGRVRLSCDIRYQPAADPLDEPTSARTPSAPRAPATAS